MVYNGESASSPQEICRLFSTKFASVFEDEQLSSNTIFTAASNVPLANQTLSAVDVNEESLSRALSLLKSSLKPGPDGVPSTFLKANAVCLLEPLLLLFRLSLSSGIFPSCWKIAEMFPVHKKGSKRDVNNYRGITSLSAVSKLFELVVMDSLNSHCKQYLSADQHGFTSGRSTTTNLLCLTSYITNGMNAQAQTDVIYTDLTAAFDKLNHEIAIAKLDRLGISDNLLGWFRTYLTGRQLVVTISDVRSDSFRATSGIPQGSHLGPVLFLLYFNDVNHTVRGPRLSFADDLKLFLRVCSIADCSFLQAQIDAFANWCILNRLSVNPAKCSVISFSRKKRTIIYSYNLLGTPIQRVHCIKDLGVLLDAKLSYSQHISYAVDKASRTLGFVFKAAKKFTDIYCLKSLYCALVRSTLEYCSAVWSPNYNNGSDRIEKIQRRFLRFALRRLPWRDPIRLPRYEDRCRLIDLDPLRIRRDVCRALTVADIFQGRIECQALLEQLDINVQPRLLRNNAMFRIPFRRNNYGLNNAMTGLQRLFNRVAAVFDYHLPREALRRNFKTFFFK